MKAGKQNTSSIPADVKMSTPPISDVSDECQCSKVEGVVKLEVNEDQLPYSSVYLQN